MTTDPRGLARTLLEALFTVPDAELAAKAAEAISEDAIWSISAPVNELRGRDAILDGFIRPLRAALALGHRRDELFIGGMNARGPGEWVASVTHLVGNFTGDLWGIRPNHRLVFLRIGEFYRVEQGQLVEAKIIVDLVDLLRQIGRKPLPDLLGTEMLFPGPATHDGVLPGNRERSQASLDLVEAMLTDLRAYDPETFQSAGQTGKDGYWAERMFWYGPGGIGSNFTYPGFDRDHRIAFLTAFPDRVGGNHYCRFGDGDYAAVSGWPSMTMTHQGPYLGVEATGKALSLRVMDFYRCADSKIQENWVLLDYIDMFQQMGVDLIAKADAL